VEAKRLFLLAALGAGVGYFALGFLTENGVLEPPQSKLTQTLFLAAAAGGGALLVQKVI
jgi:hypothetical protein